MECFDSDTVARLLEGTLAAHETAAVQAHMDKCPACRQLLSLSVRAVSDGPAEPPRPSASTPADEGARSPSLLGPGDTIGEHIIAQPLGGGAMGVVYAAYDPILDREVAVKLLRTPTSRLAGDVAARLRREARALGRLSHPSIVPVHSLGQHEDGRPYYSMKRVRGITLAEALDGCSSLEERLRFLPHLGNVCQAIAYAHSQGVMHRDIKPRNIMVGDFGETVVVDWGLAKIGGVESPSLEMGALSGRPHASKGLSTAAGKALGTPAYMSPEQAAGRLNEVDERSDVWSLGAVLYELLTGEPPFVGETVEEVLAGAKAAEIRPVLSLCRDAPPELAAVAHRALARDKADRYPSAAALAEDLRAFMTEGTVSVYDYPRWQTFKRFARHHRIETTAVALVTAVIITATILLGAAWRNAVRAREGEAQQRRAAQVKRAEAQLEGARAAYLAKDPLQARARLREAIETEDSAVARTLWGQLRHAPLVWQQEMPSLPLALSYSPDGATLAVALGDTAVRLIDVHTLSSRTLRGAKSPIMSLAFARQGSAVAASTRDGDILVWPNGDGPARIVGTQRRKVYNVRWTQDGRSLLTTDYGGSLHVWDTSSGAITATLPGHDGIAFAVAVSPDGRMLASGGSDALVRLWDASTNALRHTLRGHRGAVLALAFTTDGKRLVSAGEDGKIRIWDVDTGTLVRALVGHTDTIYSVAVSADGRLLASGSSDQTVRLWQLALGEQVAVFADASNEVYDVSFSPDSELVAACSSDNQVRLWRTTSGKPEAPRATKPTWLGDGAFSPDGKLFSAAGADKRIRLFDVVSGGLLGILAGHEGSVFTVAFTPDGRHLVSGSMDRTARIWDLETPSPGRVLFSTSAAIAALALSPDGTLVAASSSDGTVGLWALPDGRNRRLLQPAGGVAGAVAFNGQGTRVAAVLEDGPHVWDVASGRLLARLVRPLTRLGAVSYAPDGKTLAFAGDDGAVQLWDTTSSTARTLARAPANVNGLEFSPSGEWLGAALSDGSARLWAVAESAGQKPEVRLSGHQNEVNAIRFSRDGALVATVSDDGTTRLHEAQRGRPRWWLRAFLLDPPEALNGDSWSALGPAGTHHPATKWRRAIEERAFTASDEPSSHLGCLSSYDAGLELWDTTEDRLVRSAVLTAPTGVTATAWGCLVVDDGRALLLSPALGVLVLAEHARSATWDGTGIVTITPRDLLVLDTLGGQPRSLEVGADATVAVRAGEQLAVGYEDGNLALFSLSEGRPRPRIAFLDRPSAAISHILFGPMDTIVLGAQDGLVGVWSTTNGVRLDQVQLHGPTSRLAFVGRKLVATSELGSVASIDLDILHWPYCEIMRDVWAAAPVTWEHGRPVLVPIPREHPCASSARGRP